MIVHEISVVAETGFEVSIKTLIKYNFHQWEIARCFACKRLLYFLGLFCLCGIFCFNYVLVLYLILLLNLVAFR